MKARQGKREKEKRGEESCDEDGGGGRWEYSGVEMKHARIQYPPHLTQEKKRGQPYIIDESAVCGT